jgi:hypothetical protein
VGRCSFFTRVVLVGILAFAGGVGCQLFERNVPGTSTAAVLARPEHSRLHDRAAVT